MIGARIHQARKAAGLSLRELANRVELSHTAISKFETNQLKPSSGQLIKLARVLGVRGEFFFRPLTVAIKGVEFRKRASLGAKAMDRIRGDVLDQAERWQELLNLYPSPPIPAFTIPAGIAARLHTEEDVEATAEALRAAWSIGLGPIPELIDLLESIGVRVILTSVADQPRFDGLSGAVGDAPMIVVGGDWCGDRQRFTLAHELGLMVLKGRLAPELLERLRSPRKDPEERLCDLFAGAFLLPRAAISGRLGASRHALELKELDLLKHEFGLSMQATIFRARQSDIIAPGIAERLFREFRGRGWHKNEPGEPYPPERTQLFERLVYRALAEGYIGESKAAELLKMPLSRFHRQRRLESLHAVAH